MAFAITARQHYPLHLKAAGQDPICQWLRRHKFDPEDVYRVEIDYKTRTALVFTYDLAAERGERTKCAPVKVIYDP